MDKKEIYCNFMAEGPLAEAVGGSPAHEFEAGCGAEQFHINFKIGNPWSADGVASGTVSLTNFYLAHPVDTEAAVRSAFRHVTFAEVKQDLGMTPSSILVNLCCHAKESFLAFIDAFEAKIIKQRLQEELSKVGFQDELEVTFANERQVYDNLNMIR